MVYDRKQKRASAVAEALLKLCRDDLTRTDDAHVPNVVR